MPLASDRNTPYRTGELLSIGVKAATVLFGGALACVDASGWAVPGSASAALRALGRCDDRADNSAGANGDIPAAIRTGTFRWANSGAGDALTAADVGAICFVVDDQTVAKTNGSGARARAGRVVEVDSVGVWVEMGRAALEPKVHRLQFAINETDTLAGTSAEMVSPVAGVISSMSAIVQKAVTTGGPVTAAVGVTAVLGLSCVIADAAAKGTIVTDTPTAGDASTVVAVGSRIQVVPDAAFATAGAISGYVEISY